MAQDAASSLKDQLSLLNDLRACISLLLFIALPFCESVSFLSTVTVFKTTWKA